MPNQHTLHLNDNNFDELVLKADRPVLVDFWAGWCGPCRAIAPSIDAVAEEFAGRALVGKLDVDESLAVARRLQIRSIPTLMVFVGGIVVEKVSGALPRERIRALLEHRVTGGPAAEPRRPSATGA